jgi:hypothetical protein
MNSKKLERAIGLGKRIGHFFVAFMGSDGFPYVNSARRIEPVVGNQFAIEEWVCPLTLTHVKENPKLAVLIWDPAVGAGFEILGEVLMFENQAFLNGFAPEVEESGYLPQVQRQLIIRAHKITDFSHALRCDDIQRLTTPQGQTRLPTVDDARGRVPACSFAPEWAEHARFGRDDDPCDDGRAGEVCDKETSECVR